MSTKGYTEATAADVKKGQTFKFSPRGKLYYANGTAYRTNTFSDWMTIQLIHDDSISATASTTVYIKEK